MTAYLPTFPGEVWAWWAGLMFVGLVATVVLCVVLLVLPTAGCDCPRCSSSRGRHAAVYDPAKDPAQPVDVEAWRAAAEAEYERLLSADEREAADRG